MASTDGNGFVEIDGSVMEGGGQILRMSTVFSALLRKPIRVTKIRAGRSKPGLRPQHLSGLQLVRDLCANKLKGDSVGSTEITFIPKDLTSGNFVADTKTAGSVGLLIQVALPCFIFSPAACRAVLKGGTDAEFAPPMDYLLEVLKPMLTHFGIEFTCNIVRRGYYPKGGGEVVLETQPVGPLRPINFDNRGNIVKITGRSWVAGVLPKKVADAMAKTATACLRQKLKQDVAINIDTVVETQQTGFGNGSGIIVIAHTSSGYRLAGSALGKRDSTAEQVGEEAANFLLNNLQHNECVDEHLQDQLICFMALAKGISKIHAGPITLHTKTAIHIIEKLTDAKFTVTELEDGGTLIECQGIGFSA